MDYRSDGYFKTIDDIEAWTLESDRKDQRVSRTNVDRASSSSTAVAYSVLE